MAGLAEVCTARNFSWRTAMYEAFSYTAPSGAKKTVFRYRIPFSVSDEQIFLAKYDIAPNKRLAFYQQYVRCIQRQIKVSEYLSKNEAPSILQFSAVEQYKDEKGISYIFLETEEVKPVLTALFQPTISAITATDVFLRLAMILRDIGKCGVVHRGFDMEEVYLNAEDKILLGGFYYAECPGLDPFPAYLPQRPNNIPRLFLDGGVGHQGTDIQHLTIAAWNVFSGLPHNALLKKRRMVMPEYAAQEISDALLLGLTGAEENCNAFRRRLLTARKLLAKTAYADTVIPYREPLLMQWTTEPVCAAPCNGANT